MIINALAPVTGHFAGNGVLMDGTEVKASFSAEEIIPNLCYGMKLQLCNIEDGALVLEAFILVSTERKSKDIRMHLIEARESFSHLERNRDLESEHEHLYVFEAERERGGVFRIRFQLESVEHFHMSVGLTSRRTGLEREVWRVDLDRCRAIRAEAA